MSFSDWYRELQELAAEHGESVADRDAWREEFDKDLAAADAFFSEYPEHKE